MPSIKHLLLSAGVAAQLALLPGCGAEMNDPSGDARKAAQARSQAKRLQQACSSQVTFDRLKQVAFDEAIRIRNADPKNLDTLATYSVVRMENPVVKTRDESLDVTVCGGRFILELPPGAERAFAGERRLSAEVEYAAQAAADGSGLVYQLKGAEPIIYKLAAFDLKSQAYRRAPSADDTELAANTAAPARVARPDEPGEPVAAPPPPPPPPQTERRPAPPPPPPPPQRERAERPERAEWEPRRAAVVSPSFNCRNARTRSERMVCSNGRLAALDRRMSSQYYASLSNADGGTRAELRRSRDRFLGYRERCRDETCVAQAYRDRMAEIEDISGGD